MPVADLHRRAGPIAEDPQISDYAESVYMDSHLARRARVEASSCDFDLNAWMHLVVERHL